MLREAYPRSSFALTAPRGPFQWSEVGAMALISLHREATPRVG